jgi:hypothetical protein
MKKNQLQIIKKLPLIILLGILFLITGFILISCGSGPGQKTPMSSEPYAAEFVAVTTSTGMEDVDFGFSFSYPNQPITAEAWIKTNSGTGCAVKSGDKENGFFLYHSTSTARFGINATTTLATCLVSGDNCIRYSVDSGVNVADGQWHHIAGVLAGVSHTHAAPDPASCIAVSGSTHIEIYVDGILKNCTVSTYITGTCTISDMIGWDEAGINMTTAYAFNGAVDEVRIWNEARTAGQIQAGMNTEITPENWSQLNPNLTLKGYWKFNEGQGMNVCDSSGFGNNGAFEYCRSGCDS